MFVNGDADAFEQCAVPGSFGDVLDFVARL